jgi:hypothetical protein
MVRRPKVFNASDPIVGAATTADAIAASTRTKVGVEKCIVDSAGERMRKQSDDGMTGPLELASGAFVHSQVTSTHCTPRQHQDILCILCSARTD